MESIDTGDPDVLCLKLNKQDILNLIEEVHKLDDPKYVKKKLDYANKLKGLWAAYIEAKANLDKAIKNIPFLGGKK